MNTRDLLSHIKSLAPWAIQHRRYLHQHPELSLQEKNTSAYCQKVLQDLGYLITPSFGHGFTADLEITGAKKRIAFRAEMDALPVTEQNQHDFVSKNQGVAHVCGHDVHMTVALFTAKILKECEQDLNCHVRFVFQPSEEELPGGAKGMIEKGCLEGVDEIYGLHTFAQLPVGEIWIRQGVLLGTSSPFTLKIIGKGCHAAKPQEGLSPISAAAKLIPAWQDLPKTLAVQYPPILSVTMLHAGTVNNVIPETLELQGALRAFSSDDLAFIQQKMRASLQALEEQGYRTELSFTESYHCVVNPEYGFTRVLAAAKVADVEVITDLAPMSFVEDFCYYLEARPGAFYFLGGGNRAKNIVSPLHSPHYDVDEDALAVGASLMSFIALELK